MLYLKALVFHYKGEDLNYTIEKEQQIKFDFKSQSEEMEHACISGVVYGLLPPATYQSSNRIELIGVTVVTDEDDEDEKVILLPELTKKFQFPALDWTTAKNIVKEIGKTYATILFERA